MELDLVTFLIVCPLIFLAGFMDSIAGGGGLVSLPAYLLAGIPPHYALGTNKLSSIMGTSVSVFRFWKNKFIDFKFMLPSVATALIGSAVGSSLALKLDEKYMQYLLLVVLPLTAIYLLRKKDYSDDNLSPIARNKAMFLAAVISFLVGGYDGFYGPGAGTFLILLYTSLSKMPIRNASGNAKLINFASNLAALVTFMASGKVIFPLALTAGLFGIAGNYIGSGLAMKQGFKIVRPIVLVVMTLLFIKIVHGQITG